MRVVRFWAAVLVCVAALPAMAGEVASLKVEGEKIVLDGKPLKIWGLRVAGAAASDAATEELLKNLDFYAESGVNALVVYYQGSSGQVKRVFAADGKSFADAAVHSRMQRIIGEAGKRGIVVVVGLFVPRKMGMDSEDPRLASREAYIEAVKLVAGELKGCRNVILSVAHDAGRSNWTGAPMGFDAEDAGACLKAAAEVAPGLPRGCGGTEHANNEAIAASAEASVILHTELAPLPVKFKGNKPVINLGLFGRNAGGRSPQGVWSDQEKIRFGEAVQAYKEDPRQHLCVHFQGWHEGGMNLNPNRFDIGGLGTREDPGTRWFFKGLDRLLHPPQQPQPGDPKEVKGGRSIFDF